MVTLRNAKFIVNVSDTLMSEMGIGKGIRTDKVDWGIGLMPLASIVLSVNLAPSSAVSLLSGFVPHREPAQTTNILDQVKDNLMDDL